MKLTILFLFMLLCPMGTASARDKPNIIVILADDLGYETIGANGGKSYRTSNLDRLAHEGVRFEHCYAQPNFTPTRTQLMTGMSKVRNYVDFGSLDKTQTTFGHDFGRAGYATGIAGKWQLGSKDASLPRHFGFDEHCLWAHMGRGERYANHSLTVNGEFKTFEGKYGPGVCQKFVLDFIRRHRSKPFFVYHPMILTHGGYEATPDSADWGKPTATSRDLNLQHFSDLVAYTDKQIGTLTQELETLGLRQNTLIASCPEKIASGKVCRDLVDMTDFLPTICEASTAAQRLQDALDQFKDARPANLDPPQVLGEKKKACKKNR